MAAKRRKIVLNHFTGKFDYVEIAPNYGYGGFSWKKIPSDLVITIPEHQQMLVADSIDIEGVLEVEGELQVIE
jgi:hypothetical protein